MGNYRIAEIKGDGIGPEIIEAGEIVLDKISKIYGHKFEYIPVKMGGVAIDQYGEPLPEEELKKCMDSDSILFGAVGGQKWDNIASELRPEKGLLKLRKALNVYANLRPAVIMEELKGASPLKDERIQNGVDIMVVRELTGGIYFGERGTSENEAYDVEKYSVEEIRRIAKTAFSMAMLRNKKVTSVDKANVLDSSKLWRKTVEEVAKEYPEVTLDHMYVDNAAMQIVSRPSSFDVILTNNIFGDILSDLLASVCGSIGILSSASVGETKRGLYEPIHGSAPDIAGQNIANPIATISSIAMMLEISFGLINEAKAIREAIKKVLKQGYRTKDIMTEGNREIGTKEMAQKIADNI